jgi:putative component of membrane protein insertase Oxa1/YidC/SpoIIIJ protein YidD
MKLLIMQFSPVSCHFFPHGSKYFPKHIISNGKLWTYSANKYNL